MFIKLIGIWIVGVLITVIICVMKAKTCYDCIHGDILRAHSFESIYCTRTHRHKKNDICEHFEEVKR